jgi:cbb3-type cytochrome oxidase maturation protein
VSVLTLCLILGGLAMGLAAGLVFVAAARSGQMDDLEDVKFQMLRKDHDA